MIVIGIDPSMTGTGIADPDGQVTIKGEGDERLHRIYAGVEIHAERALLAVVEDLPTHAHGAGKTGMAQGVVRLALIKLAVPYALVSPATLKKFATGNGGANKPDMRMALYKRVGIDLRDDNQVDAWWLRAMGCQWLGYPIIDLPKINLATMDKVQWPDMKRIK